MGVFRMMGLVRDTTLFRRMGLSRITPLPRRSGTGLFSRFGLSRRRTGRGLFTKTNERQTVVLRVRMQTEKGSRKVEQALKNIAGVEEYDINLTEGRVTVMGRVDPMTLVRRLQRKSGKKVDLWTEKNLVSSKFSWGSSSKFGLHNSFKQATNIFSEDNPNNCTIM